MTKYWVYVNDAVAGPYSLEQLIRLRGFSRQTQVCVDQGGAPGEWMSPARIPELAHIFEAADQLKAPPPPAPRSASPKPAPVVRPVVKSPPPAPAPQRSRTWLWLCLLAALFAAGAAWYSSQARREALVSRRKAIDLIENLPLPPRSLYSSLRQYAIEKQRTPRWLLEATPDGLWNATLSWTGENPAPEVYAFEANLQAQNVRGLNTAAQRLLAEGFPRPQPAATPAAAAKTKPKRPSFDDAIGRYSDEVQKGDFAGVWNQFSERKKAEMAKAGISEEGFERLQSLTHRLEQGLTQTALKMKKESDDRMLVLLKQSEARRPDLYIKQLWILEDGEWKLDDEQKKTADSAPVASSAPAPAAPASAAESAANENPPPPPAARPAPSQKALLSLPGVSN